MNFSNGFFKTMSVCSYLAGLLVLVFLLLNLCYPAPSGVADLIELQGNLAFRAALWTNLVIMFFVLASFWGVAARKINSAPGLATTGFIISLIDFLPGMILNSTQIFTVQVWAERAALTSDEAERAQFLSNIGTLYASMSGLMFLMFVGALVASILLGTATWKGDGTEKVVGFFYFFLAAGTVMRGAGAYGGLRWLSGITAWAVPVVAGILFFAIGVWLWKGNDGIIFQPPIRRAG